MPASADEVFMDRALALAARGMALASPNPMVGAVLVREGRVVGEGFHTYDGVRHAEVIALEAAGQAAKGATAYVTLEPCCHTGRTGPCTQALIQAGVKRVVAAMADPNPAVAGRGFQQLHKAGIKVRTGIREAEAQRMNEAFARWIVSRKPLVTLKSAITLDGHLVLPGAAEGAHGSPKFRWISSSKSRAEVQRMRHASDALLTGVGTVLLDDPLLTDRTELPRRRKLLRVILDSKLRLPHKSRLVRSADGDVLVFTRANADSPKARALRRAGVEVVLISGRAARPDIGAVIAELGRRDILSVLLEAGGTLNSAALAAGVVDKMRVFIAPVVAGSASTPESTERLRVMQYLRNITVRPFGPDFAVEGYFRDVYGTR